MNIDKQIIKKLKEARLELAELIICVEKEEGCIEAIFKSRKIQKFLQEASLLLVRKHVAEAIDDIGIKKPVNDCFEEVLKGFRKI